MVRDALCFFPSFMITEANRLSRGSAAGGIKIGFGVAGRGVRDDPSDICFGVGGTLDRGASGASASTLVAGIVSGNVDMNREAGRYSNRD